MLTDDNPYQERFHALLEKIRGEVNGLRKRIGELEEENRELREELDNREHRDPDIFAALDETERMAMHHQVLGLISKIDEHLDEEGGE